MILWRSWLTQSLVHSPPPPLDVNTSLVSWKKEEGDVKKKIVVSDSVTATLSHHPWHSINWKVLVLTPKPWKHLESFWLSYNEMFAMASQSKSKSEKKTDIGSWYPGVNCDSDRMTVSRKGIWNHSIWKSWEVPFRDICKVRVCTDWFGWINILHSQFTFDRINPCISKGIENILIISKCTGIHCDPVQIGVLWSTFIEQVRDGNNRAIFESIKCKAWFGILKCRHENSPIWACSARLKMKGFSVRRNLVNTISVGFQAWEGSLDSWRNSKGFGLGWNATSLGLSDFEMFVFHWVVWKIFPTETCK